MRGAAGAAALLLAAGIVVAAAAPPTLDFDRVFATAGEPAGLHYMVAYRTGGAVHRVEVWRDGERRIARRTDGFIATYAVRARDAAGYRLSVLDDRRRIRTDIDRTNLYRIGSFTDWFDLGHGLRHPKSAYTLTAIAAPARAPRAIAACRWYALTERGRPTNVCWSERDRVPLLMTTGAGVPIWRVLSLAVGPLAETSFAIRDHGYVRNNADQDIERD